MDEEEDFPVLEIPVHISKRLAKQVYIFQYLDKFPNFNFNDLSISKSAIKPEHQEVVIEAALATDSVNYDPSKGEDIVVNVDGMSKFLDDDKDKEKPYFDSDIMDKHKFITEKAVGDCSTYAVGLLQQNEIHLTPVKGILQFRTGLDYIDEADKRAKKVSKKAENEDLDNAAENATSEVEAVTVRFAENDKAKRIHEQSYAYYSRRLAEEPWINTKWHHINSCQSDLERMNLSCVQTQDVGHALALGSELYTEQLIPQQNESRNKSVSLTDETSSLSALRKLSLIDQCKNLLKDAKLLSLDQIASILKCENLTQREELLTALSHAGVLVRGLWAPRSELLYPTGTRSAINGVLSEAMCRARDYVLFLFTQVDCVNRREVAQAVKIPPEEIKEIFSGVAEHCMHVGWVLRLPLDDEFAVRHPEVAQRQKLVWDAKARQFADLPDGKATMTRNRQRKRISRESTSSDASADEKSVRTHRKRLEISQSAKKHPKYFNREASSSGADVPKVNGVFVRDNSFSSDNDSGTEHVLKSSNSRKRTKVNNGNTSVFIKSIAAVAD